MHAGLQRWLRELLGNVELSQLVEFGIEDCCCFEYPGNWCSRLSLFGWAAIFMDAREFVDSLSVRTLGVKTTLVSPAHLSFWKVSVPVVVAVAE